MYNSEAHCRKSPCVKEFARSMRKNPTEAERLFWNAVRGSRLGFKFRRQFSINNKYIADFICLEKRLIIEIDGGQHCESVSDGRRTRYLEGENFHVIRFYNNNVLGNLDGCLQVVMNELEACFDCPPHPNPLPQGERELCADVFLQDENNLQASRNLDSSLHSPSPLAGEGWGEGDK